MTNKHIPRDIWPLVLAVQSHIINVMHYVPLVDLNVHFKHFKVIQEYSIGWNLKITFL